MQQQPGFWTRLGWALVLLISVGILLDGGVTKNQVVASFGWQIFGIAVAACAFAVLLPRVCRRLEAKGIGIQLLAASALLCWAVVQIWIWEPQVGDSHKKLVEITLPIREQVAGSWQIAVRPNRDHKPRGAAAMSPYALRDIYGRLIPRTSGEHQAPL